MTQIKILFRPFAEIVGSAQYKLKKQLRQKNLLHIFGTKEDVSRGFHAHRNLKQVAICVMGSCRFVLDDGNQRDEIVLDNPATGLLIEDLIWREMSDFSSDCVLVVLANKYYDENDYIRNYSDFLKELKK